MSLAQHGSRVTPQVLRKLAIAGFGVLLFLLNFGIGAPPSAELDASWMEVVGWGFLHHVQWGRDLVFTYGPLGFLHDHASYVPGILPAFFIGQVMLTGMFAGVVTVTLTRAGNDWLFLLFGTAYVACYPLIPSDTSWFLILLLGTLLLLRWGEQPLTIAKMSVVNLFASAFAAIALLKVSLFPLWMTCAAAIVVDSALLGLRRRALVLAALFPAALIFGWIGCAQSLSNFPEFMRASAEVAIGYGHAMGSPAQPIHQFVGIICAIGFGALIAYASWHLRSHRHGLIALGLILFGAFLGWRMDFTRGDHAPWFFGLFAMLPIAALADPRMHAPRFLPAGLVALCLICAGTDLYATGVLARWQQLRGALTQHARVLTHPHSLQAERETQWTGAKNAVALPRIRKRVGNARVDVLTIAQGAALLNDLNFAPRPIFQSYSAYTPYLGRRNEAYILGKDAPQFVLLKLQAIDQRLPASEDALAQIALLETYRPVLSENGFLLLQRDASRPTPLPITPPAMRGNAQLGEPIAVDAQSPNLTLAFVDLDLSWLGHIYTFLLREPMLRIKIETDSGSFDYRFIAASASAGFVLSPLIRDTTDWARLPLGAALPRVRSFRIEPQSAWQRVLFKNDFRVAFGQSASLPAGSADQLELAYPGFNLMPSTVQGNNDVIIEDGSNALFLHAPGLLAFSPSPGTYRISGEFGIRNTALTDPACKAADGIGMTLVSRRGAPETPLLHLELDPFHNPDDSGPHQFTLDNVTVMPGGTIPTGGTIGYRIDPGHRGHNTACDWSYVRDLHFDLVAPLPASP